MPVEVILPKVDMDMETGKVAAWHIREGEKVKKGAPLFDIETDKAAMEVESPASGTLRYVSAELGTVAPIGATIAWIYLEGEADAPPVVAQLTPKSTPQATPEDPVARHRLTPAMALALIEATDGGGAHSLALRSGARIIGGCCGTTAGHLVAMKAALEAAPEELERPSLDEIEATTGGFSSETDGVHGHSHAAPRARRGGRRRG